MALEAAIDGVFIGVMAGQVHLSESDRKDYLPCQDSAFIIQVKDGFVGIVPRRDSYVPEKGGPEGAYRPKEGDEVMAMVQQPCWFQEDIDGLLPYRVRLDFFKGKVAPVNGQ